MGSIERLGHLFEKYDHKVAEILHRERAYQVTDVLVSEEGDSDDGRL